MTLRTHVPEDAYLRKIGLVAYMVTSLEGLLLFDLPRLESVLPPQLHVSSLAGKTTQTLGEKLVKHAPEIADPEVADYLTVGGRALLELAPQRNAVLHARPATDGRGRTRLYRWRPPDAHFIDDDWLDRLIQRLDDLQNDLNGLRPPLSSA